MSAHRHVRERRAPFAVLALRFVAGHHLDGRRRSDATFLRDGTQGEPSWWGTGRESRWVLMAGWKRAALRLAVVAALAGLWRWRTVTEWALGLVLGPAAGYAVWRCVRAVRRWRHVRTLERPMALALAPFLGVASRQVEAALAVRPDYELTAGGEHIGSLGLPDHWAATADQRERLQQVIGARLGVEVRYGWRTAQHPMVLNLTRAPQPPAMVRWADVLAEIEACPTDKVLLGADSSGQLVYGDLALEDPHWAVNAGSRRGKTTLLLSIAVQVGCQRQRSGLPDDAPECAHGRTTGIDPKRVSLAALAGLPGVELHADPRDVEGMWAGIAAFRAHLEARVDAFADDPTVSFERSLLIIDEVNQFAAMSAARWREVKAKSDPALPPVWSDVAAVGWMGAQFKCNIIAVGQRLDQGALGGLRDSFGVRLLAGYTPQQYAFLVGLPPYQRPQKPRGRFLLFEGGELTWLQLVYGEPAELRDYARGNAADLAGSGSHVSVADTAMIGLREAVERGVIRCTLDAARRARADDPQFPTHHDSRGQERLYAAGELRAWQAGRPRAGRVAGSAS